MCAVMLIPVAGVKFSSTVTAAPELRNLGLRQQTSTAVILQLVFKKAPKWALYGRTLATGGIVCKLQGMDLAVTCLSGSGRRTKQIDAAVAGTIDLEHGVASRSKKQKK